MPVLGSCPLQDPDYLPAEVRNESPIAPSAKSGGMLTMHAIVRVRHDPIASRNPARMSSVFFLASPNSIRVFSM